MVTSLQFNVLYFTLVQNLIITSMYEISYAPVHKFCDLVWIMNVTLNQTGAQSGRIKIRKRALH